jgi:hypothetical protein
MKTSPDPTDSSDPLTETFLAPESATAPILPANAQPRTHPEPYSEEALKKAAEVGFHEHNTRWFSGTM